MVKKIFIAGWNLLSHPNARVIRYLISGGTATAANFAVLFICTEFLHIWYMISSVLALGVGFIVSFILQKFWTFTNTSMERTHIQFQLHIALGLANVTANIGILYVIVEQLHLWYMFGQFISAGLLALFNYRMYKLFIFHK